MKASFNKYIFGLWLVFQLQASTILIAQDNSLSGRVTNAITKLPVPAGTIITAKVPIVDNSNPKGFRKIDKNFITQESGFYSITIEKSLKLTDISITKVRGYGIRQNVQPDNKDIWVIPTKEYSLNVLDHNGLPMNAYLQFGQKNHAIENGRGTLTTTTNITTGFPLSVYIEKPTLIKGTFVVQHVSKTGQNKGQAYWIRGANNQINIHLPVTNTLQTYRVKNKNKLLKNLKIELQHNNKIITTDSLGHLRIPLILRNSTIGVDGYEIIDIDENNNILTKKTGKVSKSKETPKDSTRKARIEKSLNQLGNIDQKWKLKTDSLKKAIDLLSKKETISATEVKQLTKQIDDFKQNFQKDIADFRGELLAAFFPNNEKLQKQYGKIDTIITFDYLKILVKNIAKEKQEKNKANRWLYASTILSLLIIIGGIIRHSRKSHVLVTKISTKAKQLDEQVTQLRSQENLIRLLLNEMKHRAGNDLVSIKSEINSIHYQITDKEARKYLHEVEGNIDKLMDIQNSLNYSFTTNEQSDQLELSDIKFNLNQITNTLCNFHFDKSSRPSVNINVQTNALTESRFTLIGFCAFELINNACKYAFTGKDTAISSSISVELSEEANGVSLIISNNGHSMPRELFDEKKEFLFGKIRNSKGMNIVRRITEVENGYFRILTAGIHDEITEGSKFQCIYKY